MKKMPEIIESKAQLIDYIAQGEKPRSDWRIGTEHEKFVFSHETCSRAPYEGEHGIQALLQNLHVPGAEAILEQNKIIGLKLPGGGSITLEPGGQLELSGALLTSIHETCAEINQHLEQLRPLCRELNLTLIGIGHDPISRRKDIHWMPKGRYKIMREYMPKRGNLGIDMMTRTCTVQVNLDYCSEQDMREKMRISTVFQPIATALFANSPFKEMRPSGLLSTRAHCWTDTDPDRTGMPDMLFDDHFGYEQWVDYILDVPMYFLYQNGTYLDVTGESFRDLMSGSLARYPGRQANMQDWENHLTVAFPEVRLKKFIEMRGADAGRWDDLFALPAFWVGLLYDQEAQAEALEIAKQFTASEIQALSKIVPQQGLSATLHDNSLWQWAEILVRIACDGLKRRKMLNHSHEDESQYLEPIQQILEIRQSSAEKLLKDLARAHDRGLFSGDAAVKPCVWLINRLRN